MVGDWVLGRERRLLAGARSSKGAAALLGVSGANSLMSALPSLLLLQQTATALESPPGPRLHQLLLFGRRRVQIDGARVGCCGWLAGLGPHLYSR